MGIRRASIRRRVIVALAVLLTLGLAATDVVIYLSVHEFLSERLDAQLASARAPIERYLGDVPYGACPSYSTLDNLATPSVYIMTFHVVTHLNRRGVRLDGCGSKSDEVVRNPDFASGSSAAPDPQPALPATIHFSHPIAGKVYDPRIADANLSSFTVGAVGKPHFVYRVQAVPLPFGGALVAAAPLAPMDNLLANLIRVELGVSLAALAVVVGVAVWLVRLGLRPLEGMAAQADAIAAGELSRRVEPSDPVTETGRLGAALNAMLEQIEGAFTAREASEARLRRFVADVSHELRTPLTSIRGYAELFRRGARTRPDDLERAMSRIESEAARMTALVDDLMLLARLDQGREIENAPVNLAAVASDAVADASVIDVEREVILDAPDPVVITGDENRLRQLVVNLVSNALRHTPAGTPVKVSVSRENGTARVDVWDGGPGIPEDVLPHIFERFHTSATMAATGDIPSNGENGVAGGTGLGLSIVQAIARAHEGRVWASSTVEEGTTFHVELKASGP